MTSLAFPASSVSDCSAYAGLVAIGGVIGWIKAGSAASLIAVRPKAAAQETKQTYTD